MNGRYVVGADVGGSHIRSLVVDLKLEQIVDGSQMTCKVDKHGTADEILNVWKTALDGSISKIDKTQLAGIGIAMPGPFDYEKGIALFANENAKFENLYGVNVGVALMQLLNLSQSTPIRFINDATSFAMGEAWIGRTVAHNKSIAITLGTGFGSAFIESGIPVLERNDVPRLGCVWHLPYKDGIADDYFSTRWFVNRCKEVTGLLYEGVREISAEAPSNQIISAVFDEFGTNLGEFLAPWIRGFDASCLVIGGNVIGAYHLWGPSFLAKLHSEDIEIEVVLSHLMETSAMVGSARLLTDPFWHQIKPLLAKM